MNSQPDADIIFRSGVQAKSPPGEKTMQSGNMHGAHPQGMHGAHPQSMHGAHPQSMQGAHPQGMNLGLSQQAPTPNPPPAQAAPEEKVEKNVMFDFGEHGNTAAFILGSGFAGLVLGGAVNKLITENRAVQWFISGAIVGLGYEIHKRWL